MYVPEGRVAYAERPGLNTASFNWFAAFHTTTVPLTTPVSAIHVQTGASVANEISTMDRQYLKLNEDPNRPAYQTVQLDFGDLSSAPMIKLIVDGRTQYPTTAQGSAAAQALGPRTKVEVIGTDGAWHLVPTTALRMAACPAFRRPILLNMTGLFPTSDYRVRLTWAYKVYVDALLLDTSPDETIDFVPLPIISADLHHRGLSRTTAEEVYELIYEPAIPSSLKFFPGAYTKFGDVTPLLTDVDDKSVITFVVADRPSCCSRSTTRWPPGRPCSATGSAARPRSSTAAPSRR